MSAEISTVPTSAYARIVVVDSEPLNLAEIEAFLCSLGYRQVVGIIAGTEALDAMREAQPDVVLIDLAQRQSRDDDLLAQLRADLLLRDIPVIAITDQDERSSRLRALESGVADYLVKPIDATDLELRLRNILVTKSRQDRLAYTDRSTGLPNRESSLQQLDWALKFARRHKISGAVLQIGLNRFKQINEAIGPALGDELLRAVGQRLLKCVRESDLVTCDPSPETSSQVNRSDGDEFTVLLPSMAHSDYAVTVANRIVESMVAPFTLAGHEIHVTCQIGIAVFPHDTLDKDMVLRQAKLAMRHGRTAGDSDGSSFKFYSQELNLRTSQRMVLERELRRALDSDQLVLHYQPKVDIVTGRVEGAEALVRWQHPERGLLGPGAFIEMAEESGLIVPLGEWVLREALRQTAAWRRADRPPIVVAVNVSSHQLRRPHLERTVGDALASHGLGGECLCLELTESAIMETGTNATETLDAIKALGVRLSLDDFGTGYSSLSYLCRFPIDELKIDRSFVSDCDAIQNSALITQAIITMAHGLRLSVVAEGVETESQLDFLRTNACDQYQGYLFSRPLPAWEFQALLDTVALAGKAAEAVPA